MEFKKKIIAKYDTTWKSYDELYGEEQNRKYEAILNNLPPTEMRETVIDIGCGTGSFICKIIDKTVNIIGIDLSYNMLKEAKRKIRVTL